MAKILIIDDDPQICRVLSEFLRRQGHEATIAANGNDGLLAAKSTSPDLILCDLEMPVLNGQGVVSALRKDNQLGEVPIIYLSGCTDRSQIRSSMNLGGDDFITKPAQLPEILEAVNARLGRRQKQVQQLDRQIEQAAEYFVGIIHDLNQSNPEVRWLADGSTEPVEQQNQIIKRVRQSLATKKSAAPKITPPNLPTSLLVKNNNRQQYLKLSAVKALMANGEYSNVYWGKDEHLLFRKPLKQWEKELPAEQFVRVHRQAIINLEHLDFVEKDPTGKSRIHLREFKEVIPVSQRETAAFNRCLKNFKAH